MSIVHAIVDRVVDDYAPVLTGIENDVDEIENEVFGGESREVSRRIYRLSREVIEFRRATGPLPDVLARLIDESGDDEEKRYLRDVQDHAIRVHERLDGFHELLRNILNVNLTLETKALNEAGNRQNEEVKRISAWAAILFAPTLVDDLWDELRAHARVELAAGLSDGARAHGRGVREPVPAVQAPGLDEAAARNPSGRT